MQLANFSHICDIPEPNGENYEIEKERIFYYDTRKDEPFINEILNQDETGLHCS